MTPQSEPVFWMVMTYACDSCNEEHTVFLEDGCEGPRDWEAPFTIPSGPMKGEKTVALTTESGRVVVPVPFTVSCDCGGWFRHINWSNDSRLAIPVVGIPEAPHFRYPSKTERKKFKEQACGRPVGLSAWNMPT